jgi:hypothetical protein
MKFSCSFNISPAAAPKPAEKLALYSYNEFFLDLPEHWRQVATSNDNTLNWHSEVVGNGEVAFKRRAGVRQP